jgi:hypothetical protein
MMKVFMEAHQTSDQNDHSQTRIKNILNCFLHFYLFQSVSADLLFGFIKFLLLSFKENDIEILIFLLHNIGL